MTLLPPKRRAELPKLHAQEKNRYPTVYAKFFMPFTVWTWYATEGQAEGDDFRFFGYVAGFEGEWGYFMLSELESTRGPMGLPIKRDLRFTSAPINEVFKREGRR